MAAPARQVRSHSALALPPHLRQLLGHRLGLQRVPGRPQRIQTLVHGDQRRAGRRPRAAGAGGGRRRPPLQQVQQLGAQQHVAQVSVRQLLPGPAVWQVGGQHPAEVVG